MTPSQFPPLEAACSLAAQSRVLQLASQALPTGAFAYSGGVESAMTQGDLEGEVDGCRYLLGLFRHAFARVELPLFLRMFDAFGRDDFSSAARASQYLLASREAAELQEQDRQMARALARVMKDLWGSGAIRGLGPLTFAEALAQACVHYSITRSDALVLCAYTWIDQHATALARLVPLGPLASQRVVDQLLLALPAVVQEAAQIPDDEVGGSAPGFTITCSLHETQYSRVFRS